jgi:hypothetical protein
LFLPVPAPGPNSTQHYTFLRGAAGAEDSWLQQRGILK